MALKWLFLLFPSKEPEMRWSMPVTGALIAHKENGKCLQACGLQLSRDRWWEGEKSSASRAVHVSCAREESGICSSTPSCLLIRAPPPAPAVRPSICPSVLLAVPHRGRPASPCVFAAVLQRQGADFASCLLDAWSVSGGTEGIDIFQVSL